MTQFSDKFIAFIDILGFKSFRASAERGQHPSLEKLLGLTVSLGSDEDRRRIERGSKLCPGAPSLEPGLNFRVTQVSDCAVISSEVSPAGIINLIAHCFEACLMLLREGVLCRGYIKRGNIFHTDSQFIGSGYEDAYQKEGLVSVFGRELGDIGTPFVEIDPEVVSYVNGQGDRCVRMMFDRMVGSDGERHCVFPFKRLTHTLVLRGSGPSFDANVERERVARLRVIIEGLIAKVEEMAGQGDARADHKCRYYTEALRKQLRECDHTEQTIERLVSPTGRA